MTKTSLALAAALGLAALDCKSKCDEAADIYKECVGSSAATGPSGTSCDSKAEAEAACLVDHKATFCSYVKEKDAAKRSAIAASEAFKRYEACRSKAQE